MYKLILDSEYKIVSNKIYSLKSPTLEQDRLQVSKDRRLCVVGKSFAYLTRISNDEKDSLVLILAIVILLASIGLMSSDACGGVHLYKFSNPINRVHPGCPPSKGL